jgi:hypothetical protein
MLQPLFRHLARRFGLAGLIALGLLLPLAQSLGAWHALSHMAAQQAGHDTGDAATLGDARCDLCLAVSAVDGGSLLPALPPVPAVGATQQPAADPPVEGRVAPPCVAYLSRAPPSSHG